MGEYASRGPSHEGPVHTSSNASTPHAPVPTPADRARDAVSSTAHRLDFVRRAIKEVNNAHEANDRARWSHAKHELDQALTQAERSLERARKLETDATPDQKSRLETTASELATVAEKTKQAEPPNGYATVAHEDALRDALHERSNERLNRLLDELTTTELRILRNRIANPAPHDAFATTVWGLGPTRRIEISDFIHNVDRRKARERVAARRAPAPAPVLDTLDTKLRRAFDSADVEIALGAVVAAEDGAVRRAIADRFRRYRPGAGDDIAARFIRLDDAVKARIFAELGKEKLRDATRAPVESFLTPPSMLTVPPSRVPEPDSRDPMKAFRETKVDLRDDSGWYEETPTTQATVLQYLAKHEAEIWSVVQTALAGSEWPGVSPRVTIDDVQFDTVLGYELHDSIGDFSNRRIAELVAPEDVFAAVAPMVPADAAGSWNPTVGFVISQHLQRSLVRSVIRMSGRFVDACDAVGLVATPVDLLGRLPFSVPLDRIVAHALSRHISIAGDAKAKAKTTALLRLVKLHWQGGRLWNVVRTEPANATVEEVAAALGRGNASDDAYLIAAAPPLFSVPTAWALQIDEARANAPVALRRGPVDVGDDRVETRLAALATSSAADEIAHAQVGTKAQHIGPELLDQTFDESLILLEQLRKLLTPWDLSDGVSSETMWTSTKRSDLHHATPLQIADWTAIAPAQRQRLASILAFATQVDRAAVQVDSSRRGTTVARQRSILALLASAAATSHLATTSDTALAEAATQQRNESLRSFDINATNVDATMDQARERLEQEDGPNATKDENGNVVHDTASREQWTPYTQLREQSQDIQRRVAAGQTVDPAELERVELEMQDTNIRQRLHAMQLTLDQLNAERILAAEGLVAHVVATSSFKSLRNAIAFIHQSIGEIYIDLNFDAKALSTGGVSRIGDEVAVRKSAVMRAQTRFESLSTERDLGHFLQRAAETIHDQQTRTMLVKLGVMILASIAIGAATGGLGLVGVEGALATVAVEAVGNGAVQYLLSAGERNASSLVEDIGENLFYAGMNKFVIGAAVAKGSAMMKPYVELMNRELAAIAVQETRASIAARKVGGVVAWAAKETVVVSAHAISGMALGATYAHARAAMAGHEASAQTVGDFELQALGVTIGKYVHVAVSSSMARFRAHAQLSAKATPLLESANRLEAETRSDKPTDAATSLKRLRDLAALHEQELALLDELDRDPSHGGPSAEERAERRTQLQHDIGEIKSRDMLELQWQVLGIRQLTPEIWTGTPSDLDHALSQARAFGFTVELGEQSPDVTHVTVNGKALEFHVVSDAKPSSASRSSRSSGPAGPDLHSHMMGVNEVDYFVNKIGHGNAIRAFDVIVDRLSTNPSAQKKSAHAWEIASKARSRIETLRGEGAASQNIEQVAQTALDDMLAAGPNTAFDLTYPIRQFIVENLIDPGGGSYREYTRDTMRALADEGIGYSEQSVGLGKLQEKFPAEMMDEVHRDLAKLGKDVDVRFLAMVGTKALGGEVSEAEATAAMTELETVLKRGDVIGIDIAGPERLPFTQKGMEAFDQLYELVSTAAKFRNRSLVVRPHVGEGYDDAHDGSHAKLAHDNLTMLITQLKEMGYSRSKGEADRVIIRFGHATHASPDQLEDLARLGVIVEANIGSNLITGSVADIQDHPLLFNLYYGVETVLGTDGGGVIRTTRAAEYKSARKLIGQFRAEVIALDISGLRVRFRDLDEDQRSRFSIDNIKKVEDEYHRRVLEQDTLDKSR